MTDNQWEPPIDRKYDWVGPPDKLSKIRPIRLRRPIGESDSEFRFRKLYDEAQEWNRRFWENHNQKFEKVIYYDKNLLNIIDYNKLISNVD